MARPRRRKARMIAAIVLSISTGSVAASPQSQARPKAKKYMATQEITVDKATGALRRPTATETQELVATLVRMLNTSSEGLDPKTLPNGVVVVDLEGRFAPVMLAKPNPDGTTEVRCVTTFEEATAFLGLVEDPSQQ